MTAFLITVLVLMALGAGESLHELAGGSGTGTTRFTMFVQLTLTGWAIYLLVYGGSPR